MNAKSVLFCFLWGAGTILVFWKGGSLQWLGYLSVGYLALTLLIPAPLWVLKWKGEYKGDPEYNARNLHPWKTVWGQYTEYKENQSWFEISPLSKSDFPQKIGKWKFSDPDDVTAEEED